MLSPLPAATTAEYGGGETSGGCSSTLPSSWVKGTGAADALVVFCLEARRLLKNTASAIRTAPATAETIPATVGVESEVDVCSGLVGEVTPNEGAGVGVGEDAASYRVGAAVGIGGVKAEHTVKRIATHGVFNEACSERRKPVGAKGEAGQFYKTLFYCLLISQSSKETSINSGRCQNAESEVTDQAHHLRTTNPTELFSCADLAFI